MERFIGEIYWISPSIFSVDSKVNGKGIQESSIIRGIDRENEFVMESDDEVDIKLSKISQINCSGTFKYYYDDDFIVKSLF